MPEIDELGMRLLDALRSDPCLNQSQLARKVGVNRNTCMARLKVLKSKGYIMGAGIVLGPSATRVTTKFLLLKTSPKRTTRNSVEAMLRRHNRLVTAFDLVAGDYSYIATVADQHDPQGFLSLINELTAIRGVKETLTYTVVQQ